MSACTVCGTGGFDTKAEVEDHTKLAHPKVYQARASSMKLNQDQIKRESLGWCSAILVGGVDTDRRWCQQPLGHDDDHFNKVMLLSEWAKVQAEGVKYDKDKPRWDLLPLKATALVVDVLTYGAKKYAPENWRKVEGWRWRYFGAALRHMVAWFAGEKIDPESGHHHLAHAACCVLFMLELDSDL